MISLHESYLRCEVKLQKIDETTGALSNPASTDSVGITNNVLYRYK